MYTRFFSHCISKKNWETWLQSTSPNYDLQNWKIRADRMQNYGHSDKNPKKNFALRGKTKFTTLPLFAMRSFILVKSFCRCRKRCLCHAAFNDAVTSADNVLLSNSYSKFGKVDQSLTKAASYRFCTSLKWPSQSLWRNALPRTVSYFIHRLNNRWGQNYQHWLLFLFSTSSSFLSCNTSALWESDIYISA